MWRANHQYETNNSQANNILLSLFNKIYISIRLNEVWDCLLLIIFVQVLSLAQEVDQVKRDPAFFVSTLSQFLKEDPDPFLVHLRQSVSSNSLSYRNLSGFTVYWIPFQSDLSNSEIDIKTLQSLFILKANVIIKLDGHFHCRQILVMFYYEQTRANHFITCSSSAESAHLKQTAINQHCFT